MSVGDVAGVNADQSVLVTGAGGYIGSALVAAIARATPRCIILLDSSEQNLFEVDQRLGSAFPGVSKVPVLGSVVDRSLLEDVFTRFQPGIVYHAAAFKHVPLLEQNPCAAVSNNAIGTYRLAQATIRHGATQLILVSTDKAANPRSIMGASKRLAELAVVAMSSPSCRMNAIRLVNVIGSPGSVIPIFRRQIADGGPVTVTHPDASRWFMPVDEAVDAILSSANARCEGRIFLPAPGNLVRITDLARSLMGDREVPIRFTGLRPGDKLTEEMLTDGEMEEGSEGGLRAVRTRKLSCGELGDVMNRLSACVETRDAPALIQELSNAELR